MKRGEPVTLLYQWGHPFEHQLFDAPAPDKVLVLSPDGKSTDVTKRLEKVIAVAAEAKTAYRLRFTPEERGDYVFSLVSAPIWMAEEQLFYQDTSGHWSGVVHGLRPDVAIIAAAGRGNIDGEPIQGSLAQFVARQASLPRARASATH